MILDIENIKAQFDLLGKSGEKAVSHKWSLEFVVGQITITSLKVMVVDLDSDYESTHTDSLNVSALFSQSDSLILAKANRRVLECKLVKTPTGISKEDLTLYPPRVVLYDAHILDNNGGQPLSKPGGHSGNQTDDMYGLVTIDVQLVEKGSEEFSAIDFSGTYHNLTLDTLIKWAFSQPIKTLDDKNFGVNVEKMHNSKTFFQILVPNGYALIDLVWFLQKKYGCYTCSYGCYLTRGQWYIYSLYNTGNKPETSRTLTILNVPENEMVGLSNSFMVNEGGTFIFATRNSMYVDDTERGLNNHGAGWRGSISGNQINGFADHSKGVTTIPPDRNKMEFQFDQRDGRLVKLDSHGHPTTDNVFELTSKVSKSLGALYTVIWEQSEPDLLYPGTLTRVLYKNGNEVKVIEGTLLATHTAHKADNALTTDDGYSSVTTLTLFVKKEYYDEEIEGVP